MRRFKDRDFLRTPENFFFCVVGYLHPSDRVISYLKYSPSLTGKWGKGTMRFIRSMPTYTIPHLLGNLRRLKNNYPQYVFHSDIFNIEMSAVPLNCVEEHFCPEMALQQLLKKEELDSLQELVLNLVSLLSDESGVPQEFFGITGSVLLDIHRPEFSDIDLAIYGHENSLKVKESISELFQRKGSLIRRLTKPLLEKSCKSKSKLYPMTYEEAKMFCDRRWNYGLFKGRIFSIHPIRLDEEIVENYGDRIFIPEGIVKIRASISDASESMFLPCKYGVENATVEEGPAITDIVELTSYEGLYSDTIKAGEGIIARGMLERVIDKKLNREYHRILIGSAEAKGRDYIKPISFLR